MSTAVRNVPLPKQASAGDDPGVDTLIASIIANNAGPHAEERARLSRNKPRASDGSAKVGSANVGSANVGSPSEGAPSARALMLAERP